MRVTHSIRRLTVPIAAVLAAAGVCAACSSSNNGTPAGSTSTSSSASGPASTAASAPGGGSGSASFSLPRGSGSTFCKEFQLADLQNIQSASDVQKVLQVWDKFTKDAPSAVKSDFQKIDDYLHSAATGNADASKASELSTAGQHIGTWFAQNCLNS